MKKLSLILSNERLQNGESETEAKKKIAEHLVDQDFRRRYGYWEWSMVADEAKFFSPDLISFYNPQELKKLRKEQQSFEIISNIEDAYAFVLDTKLITPARLTRDPFRSFIAEIENLCGLFVGARYKPGLDALMEHPFINHFAWPSEEWVDLAKALHEPINKRLQEAQGHFLIIDDELGEIRDFFGALMKREELTQQTVSGYSESSVDYPIHYFWWGNFVDFGEGCSSTTKYIQKLVTNGTPCIILADIFLDETHPEGGIEVIWHSFNKLEKSEIEKLAVVWFTQHEDKEFDKKITKLKDKLSISNKLKKRTPGIQKYIVETKETFRDIFRGEVEDNPDLFEKLGQKMTRWFKTTEEVRKKTGKEVEKWRIPVQPKILDSSVLIDGKILGITKSGFIEGTMIIPRFILEEVKRIADSKYPPRREKGEKGLDCVKKLQEIDEKINIHVEVRDPKYHSQNKVDYKLVRYAKSLDAILLTMDSNLLKHAVAESVSVLNPNSLRQAIGPKYRPGDEIEIEVLEKGTHPHQGVGYADDHKKVVIDRGDQSLKQKISVKIKNYHNGIYFAFPIEK